MQRWEVSQTLFGLSAALVLGRVRLAGAALHVRVPWPTPGRGSICSTCCRSGSSSMGFRGMAALSRRHRVLITAAFVPAWSLTSEGCSRCWRWHPGCAWGRTCPVGDRPTLVRFLLLIAALSCRGAPLWAGAQ